MTYLAFMIIVFITLASILLPLCKKTVENIKLSRLHGKDLNILKTRLNKLHIPEMKKELHLLKVATYQSMVHLVDSNGKALNYCPICAHPMQPCYSRHELHMSCTKQDCQGKIYHRIIEEDFKRLVVK
jgi:hypothetical protein